MILPYEKSIVRFAVIAPDGSMPFRRGWDMLSKPEKRECYKKLKKIFKVESYESIRARISGDRRIKLSVSEAVQVGRYFYENFGIDNPWGNGLE